MDELATKADLKIESEKLRLEMERIGGDSTESKADTIPWMFGVAAGQVMFFMTILKLFPSH